MPVSNSETTLRTTQNLTHILGEYQLISNIALLSKQPTVQSITSGRKTKTHCVQYTRF